MPTIRPASAADHDAVWAILEPIVRAGETYALDRDMSREAGIAYWFAEGHQAFIAEFDGRAVGAYYLRRNQAGGGSHVANCAFITAGAAQGRGVARAMCRHALETAARQGFRAMQFNFVVSTNVRAVELWRSLGFREVGRLPGAFRHPEHGYVDALVMHQALPAAAGA